MMRCKEYIFKLTSGQLAEAEWPERFGAAQHRLMCRHCRAFSANDARLSAILSRYQDQLTQPDEPPRRPDGSSTPP